MMKAENNLGILHYALENGIIDLSYVQEKVKIVPGKARISPMTNEIRNLPKPEKDIGGSMGI